MTSSSFSRREFLRRSSLLGMLGGAAPWALNLAAIGEAAAQTAVGDDYKALVCVFLAGGNDHGNTVIPYDAANYNAYAGIRGALARPRSVLSPLAPAEALTDGRQFALAPELAGLKAVFDTGQLGVLFNVGTLVTPTTRAQYEARSVPLPPKLFSHIDQMSYWQAGSAQSASGWGGRLEDLMLSGSGASTFGCVSVTGNALMLSGNSTAQYQISPRGAVGLDAASFPVYGNQACSDALRALISESRSHLIENAYTAVTRRALTANTLLGTTLQTSAGFNPFTTANDNSLAAQLQMVARMIAARGTLGVKRQVFFVSLGGFDLHDHFNEQHGALLGQISDALSAFHAATVQMGVASQVTTFTASDFGRTLSSNGNGSDHGWGSHHVVMGGAVRGGRFWGKAPETSVNGADDVGQGRLLPTTSVDQLAAELATWFGVAGSDLGLVLPNSGNFDLGRLGLFG